VVDQAGYSGLLANRRYLLFEGSAITAAVGYSFYALTVPWLAYEYSGSLAFVGLVLFAEYGIYALTFVLAPWVDRARDKRWVYLACYPVQAAAAVVLGVATAVHALSPALLFGLVVVLSVFWDAAWAANNAVPRLLLTEDQLFRAQGFGGLVGGVGQIAAFAAAAVVLIVVGPAGGLLLYAALLGAAAALIAPVRLEASVPAVSAGYWAEFRSGWAEFAGTARGPLLGLGAAELVRGFFTAAPALLITLIAGSILGHDPAVYGTLFAATVGGGIATGLALGEWNPRRRVGRILVVALALEGAGVVAAMVAAHAPIVDAVLWFAVGSAGAAYVYAFYAYLQGSYPADRLARVTANLYVFAGVAGGVGAIVLGVAASRLAPLLLAGLVGAGLLAASGVLWANARVRSLAF
jgi:hypothetical protein